MTEKMLRNPDNPIDPQQKMFTGPEYREMVAVPTDLVFIMIKPLAMANNLSYTILPTKGLPTLYFETTYKSANVIAALPNTFAPMLSDLPILRRRRHTT
jgi:hypothetical protein